MRSLRVVVSCSVLLVVWTAPAPGATFLEASGSSAPSGPGPLTRYSVEVERGLGESPASVARQVEDRMADHRAWGAGHRRSFQRVPRGRHDVRIVLASASTTQQLCRPLNVVRYWSCYQGGVVVLNHDRWRTATPTYRPFVGLYRSLLVMHEFGHALGYGHARCPRPGAPAPPMMQQSKSLGGCARNPWPSPDAPRLRSRCVLEVERVRDTRVARVIARAEWIGTPVVLRLLERRSGRWLGLRARRTDSGGRTRWLVRMDARFLRLVMPGTAARRSCSAVAQLPPRADTA